MSDLSGKRPVRFDVSFRFSFFLCFHPVSSGTFVGSTLLLKALTMSDTSFGVSKSGRVVLPRAQARSHFHMGHSIVFNLLAEEMATFL
jgi:hypothetical protein